MKLIVGLGNPGLRYNQTRHNIGFEVIKLLAKKYDIRLGQRQFGAKFGKGLINGHDVVLFLPQKFMNVSGLPVSSFLDSKSKVKIDLLVVCDDVNLNYGHLRFRQTGTAGGHKGLGSIIECLGHEDFARLRLGVGHTGLKGDLTNFVLGYFTKEEKTNLKIFLNEAAAACETWIELGIETAANKFNRKSQI